MSIQQVFIPQRLSPRFCHPTHSSPKQSRRLLNFLSGSFTVALKHALSCVIIQVLYYLGSDSPNKLQASKSQDHAVLHSSPPPAPSTQLKTCGHSRC